MQAIRRDGGTLAAHTGAETTKRHGRHRWAVAVGAAVTLLAASSAPALVISGGPTYTLPGGGTCTVAVGTVATRNTGAQIICSGVNLAAHTHVYFGIKNNSTAIGMAMDGSGPSGAEVFQFLSSNPTTITYTSQTTITSANPSLGYGTDPVNSTLSVALASGSATVVSTGGNPATNANGAIERVFRLTSGSSFTFDVDITASDAHFSGQACTGVYDPTRVASPGGTCTSRLDFGFYYSDCGDGVVDSPEQCDQGAANGTPGSCCTSTCTFRSAGQVCRSGAGAPCDLSETCTGLSGTCPVDDATLNLGVVCRPGSGDICDQNETCTGNPGQGCPADDAPTNAGIVCRASSVGDFCDQSETCTGVPGATCPADDAPTKVNVVCRPGSGDMCDPDERCTGFPGQGCPSDVVANPSTVCRAGSGDMCDPSETCTAVPGAPCPADVVTPGGTTCRAAADVCDVAEQCTGTVGQACPANAFAPATTSCDADGNVCTIDECDGSGACVFDSPLDCEDGNSCTQDSCDPQDGCESIGQPSNSCVTATQAILKIKDADDPKDQIKLVWKGGPALVPNMGNPSQDTRYELCIYDDRGVQMAMGVPPGAGWSTIGSASSPKGFKYKDSTASNDGLRIIKLKGSNLDKGRVTIVGKGVNLPDTADLPLQYPVTAQLYAENGMCWDAQFEQAHAKKNEENQFNAKRK